ncbi:MAG: rimM [Flavipsychrobacter sp.]|jgi:16S rRNA processing protein RimM|nr:rimM [Flavipsychrobacter sp.]
MIRIGKIVATHGLNGSLIMTHIVGNSKWLKKDHVLMVEMQKGSYIPHFVSQCKAANDEEYIINIEEIDKIESAKKLVTKHVYVDENILKGYEKQSPLLWIGFNLIDKNEGNLGTIEDVLQTGSQWLAKLTYKNKEVLIPLINETINGLDIKKKTIEVTLPEGLLEVYLD